jgi:hypothetical protein
MAERELHGPIPQLLALCRREFVHARSVLLHDQRARRFLFRDWFRNFHSLFILFARANVKWDE